MLRDTRNVDKLRRSCASVLFRGLRCELAYGDRRILLHVRPHRCALGTVVACGRCVWFTISMRYDCELDYGDRCILLFGRLHGCVRGMAAVSRLVFQYFGLRQLRTRCSAILTMWTS